MIDSIIRTHQSELTIPLFFWDNKLFNSVKIHHSHSVVKSRPTNCESSVLICTRTIKSFSSWDFLIFLGEFSLVFNRYYKASDKYFIYSCTVKIENYLFLFPGFAQCKNISNFAEWKLYVVLNQTIIWFEISVFVHAVYRIKKTRKIKRLVFLARLSPP